MSETYSMDGRQSEMPNILVGKPEKDLLVTVKGGII